MNTPVLLAACLAAAGCASTPRPDMEPALSLAAAETAFAAHSVREDMRAAFLAHFADDGVLIRTGWTAANAALRDEPAPPIVLDWRPVYVETAASGDFGLSTGPWKITSKARPGAPPAYGQFVSIWKRDGNGPWKVAVDLGVEHPSPHLWDRALETRGMEPGASPPVQGLDAAEQRFAREVLESGTRAAYRRHGARDLRFYRNATAPAAGPDAALASPGMNDEKLVYQIERTEAARSGDFGYARGAYAAACAPATRLGYFMRVWRLEDGRWKVALDVASPLR